MEINFDKLQDEILDIKDERLNENRIIANKISRWLAQRPNKCFDFSEINELKNRNASAVVSYFNREDGMAWMERDELKVQYIQYHPEETDFEAVGYIDGEEDCAGMWGRNLDLESLERIVDWLAQYQREQNGTAKTAEQSEREMNEWRFGKEYYTNEKYRDYIKNQLEPEERLMLVLFNTSENEDERNHLPMSARAKFALVIRGL